MAILAVSATEPTPGFSRALRASSLMSTDLTARIDKHFASLTDPRRGKVTNPLINILTIALCATIAGADDFVAIDRATPFL